MNLSIQVASAVEIQLASSRKYRNRLAERSWSRRRFLDTVGTTAALTIVPRHVLGGTGYVPPSEKINIAVIGTGGQGIENIKQLLQEPDVQIIAVADPDEESDLSRYYYGGTGGRVPALKLIRGSDSQKDAGTGKSCAEYIDFRQMLEKEKAIDAVLVATPDHVHAVATMAAIQLGKHVYCEKPLCHSIYEVRKIAEAARQAKVATQMGNQGHSGDGIRLTCEWLWNGAIGQVREVHSWAVVEPWTELKARPKETPPLPASLNWDLWLGPAPYRPYHPAYAPVTWRCWYDFGTGILGDFACHHLDPAFWGLKLGYPTSVEATSFGGSSETYPWASIVYYEFPARGEMPPVKVVWYDGGVAPQTPEELEPDRKLSRNGHGILFVGDKGKMLCGGWGGTPRLIPESAMRAYNRPPKTIPRVQEHHRDWLDACKGGPPACANFEAIGPMVEVVLLGCISQRSGEKLYWDGPNMHCTNVAAANDYVRSPYREGWSL